jgi:MFS family permease
MSPARRRWALMLMLAITTCAFMDRAILNTVGQAIKDDLAISDLQLGLLGGVAFSILYGVLGVPVARLAERKDRITIVTIAIAVWSTMTVACGFAGNFAHLLLARVGVGVGEAGANAPVQSFLADAYPAGQRGSVVSVLGLATPIGIVLGGIGGAWVAQHHGWRAAFILVGLPGLLLALLARLTLRDLRPKSASVEVPRFGAVVRTLLASRGFRHILAGGVLASFVGQASVAFGHPFLVRNFGLGYTEAALYFALMNSVSVAGGFLIGGFVVDHFVRRDVRFYGWIPGVLIALSTIFYVSGYLQHNLTTAAILLTIPGAFAATYYAPLLAVTQNLVGSRMRATAISIVLLSLNLIGLLFGPLTAGALSDYYYRSALPASITPDSCRAATGAIEATCHAASANGVRYALVTIVLLLVWSGGHYLMSTRYLKDELDLTDNEAG